MLASRAARPSLNAASSLVSKVEEDLALQADHKEAESQRDGERMRRAHPPTRSVLSLSL